MPDVATPRDNTLEVLLDERYDFPAGAPLSDVYFVAFVPRSGSHYLCSHLWRTGAMGAPLEYFNLNKLPTLFSRFGVRYLEEYVQELVQHRTSPNGVFGLKLGRDQLSFLQLLPFDHPLKFGKWIFIDRRDKHRQAISFYMAVQSGAWSSLSRQQRELAYSFEGIERSLKTLIHKRQAWDEFFSAMRIDPIRIAYEDFAADPAVHVEQLRDRLKVPLQPTHDVTLPEFERLSTARSDEWLERFRTDLAAATPV